MNTSFGRRLLENDEMDDVMEQYGGYNPFNSPYGANKAVQSARNWYDRRSEPMAPKLTRYGMRRKNGGNAMGRFMRTGRGQMNGRNWPYNEIPNMFPIQQQMYGMGGGGYLGQRQWPQYGDGDVAVDGLFEDELDEDGFDFDDSDDAAYIEEEADFYQQARAQKKERDRFWNGRYSEFAESADSVGPSAGTLPSGKSAKGDDKKAVNKMEQIIGRLYTLSMYQVILLSNANPEWFEFYAKRWGITKDVASFINRLLFGGIYTQRIKEWLKRFDAEHLFYRESGQLFDDPVAMMQDLERYLGVNPLGEDKWREITAKVYNVELEKGKGYQHKEEAAEHIEHWDIEQSKELKIAHPAESRMWHSIEVIAMLRDYYRPHNNQLADLFQGERYEKWDY